jgi:general secretion pathway protein N
MLSIGWSMPPGASGKAVRSSGNPLWAVPMRDLAATRERPIFSPSRRPPSPPVIAQAPPQQPPPLAKPAEPERPPLAILGTVLGGRDSIGIFMEDATTNVVRLHPGQGYAGWVLRAVSRREADFAKGEAVATLRLPAPRDEQPAPVASTPPSRRTGAYVVPAAVAPVVGTPTALVERRRRD